MQNELYEESYKNPKHFSFGKNWKNFLKTLNEGRMREAESSLANFLGGKEAIAGKTFVDIGCGSGLFSLVAYRLGARKVTSVDVDEFCIACAEYLRKEAGAPQNWEIRKGSALDKNFILSLGTFDIVYSWGVLHHTGNMYQAMENITALAASEGKLYIALYNDNQKFFEGTSPFWVKAKKLYNRSLWVGKRTMELLYIFYFVFGLMINLVNPIAYILNYQSRRGMNFITDIKDWLGGYPYEYASSEKIIAYFEKLGFACTNMNPARSLGCNEFLFSKMKNTNK